MPINDVAYPLRVAFIAALRGQITYKNRVVPVVDAAALTAAETKPYILVSVLDRLPDDTKMSFGASVTVQLDVVCGYTGNLNPGMEDCDKITQLVMAKLVPSPGMVNINPAGHKAYVGRPSIRPQSQAFGSEYINRNIILFSIQTHQTEG